MAMWEGTIMEAASQPPQLPPPPPPPPDNPQPSTRHAFPFTPAHHHFTAGCFSPSYLSGHRSPITLDSGN
ncbi:hypothetical protein E2C01_081180 [Portunus trituberculatus]|uniref:Uncharacterized protein n=1 Tax=Portunus trituberculatus TaxID=210409 RepID=A0A5B7IV45_PORTR|nr:hypothetical protein [Portunus trituberculatus]